MSIGIQRQKSDGRLCVFAPLPAAAMRQAVGGSGTLLHALFPFVSS